MKTQKRITDIDEVDTVAYREVVDQAQAKMGIETAIQKLVWCLYSELQWFIKKHTSYTK